MPPSNASSGGANGRADITERNLLQSIVEVARSVFGAAAASVFLLDQQTDELVFEAVAGEGEEDLVGTRFPSGTGLAGWVVMSGQSLLVDDVNQSPQFARDAAESTGYVPTSIMAAPLIRNGDCIGVLEVLDRGTRQRGDLSDVDLIGMLATEVALALDLLVRLRWRAGRAGCARAGGRRRRRRPAANRRSAPLRHRASGFHGQQAAGDGRRPAR